ncbi:MAG: ROK family protein [Thermodesulfovibrionales bacterium]
MKNQHAIGIDIGGTNFRVALIEGEGNILNRAQYPAGDDVIELLFRAVDALFVPSAAAIGVACAGLIDRERCEVISSPNLPAVERVPFSSLLAERYHVPVFLENDANLAAFGEKSVGAGRMLRSFILLTLGTGIGGGIVHDGNLLDVPAEIGHIVVEPSGVLCQCGNHGCLEEYAAAKAMINMAVSALERGEVSALRNCCDGSIYRITPLEIYNIAREGDILAKEILRTAGRYLGIGISNLANIFRPEAFILAGGLSNAWDLYVEEALREAEKRALKGLFSREDVLKSSIQEDAGLIGAALFALARLGER